MLKKLILQLKGSENVTVADMVKKLMTGLGLWRGPEKNQITKWSQILAVIFFFVCVTQFITLFLSLNDLQNFIDCYRVLSFCSVGFLKLMSFKNNKKLILDMIETTMDLEMRQLHNQPIDHEYETDEEGEERSQLHIHRYTKFANRVNVGLTVAYWLTTVVFVAMPFAEYFVSKSQGIDIPYPHILPTWTPFAENLMTHSFFVLVEFVGALCCISVHIAFDVITLVLIIAVTGQFKLLRENVVRIGGGGNYFVWNTRRDDRAHLRIQNCHRHHVTLLRIIRKIDRILKPIMGVYFSVAALTLCSTIMLLTSPGLNKLKLFNLVQFLLATLTQLFIFSYFGDCLFQQTEIGPAQGAFASSWWSLNCCSRRDIIFLAMGMSYPKKICAGWFKKLDLPSFLATVQTAYSYYAVLRSLE